MSRFYDISRDQLGAIRHQLEQLQKQVASRRPAGPLDGGCHAHMAASEIPVEAFDLILLWPLRIKDASASSKPPATGIDWHSPDQQLARWTRRITRSLSEN